MQFASTWNELGCTLYTCLLDSWTFTFCCLQRVSEPYSWKWTLNDCDQVMVTRGFNKRACAVVLVKKVKNPIKLAREMLVRGGKDGSVDGDPSGDAGGAQGHCCLGGATVEKLAENWGLEIVDATYFWTRKRWDEHKRGLRESKDERWDGEAYLPQGTVGCVALDQYGTMCVATSTGGSYFPETLSRDSRAPPESRMLTWRNTTGLTNKLSGRIGDTPTIGAGFWAEEWNQSPHDIRTRQTQDLSSRIPVVVNDFVDGLRNFLGDCIPNLSSYQELPSFYDLGLEKVESMSNIRAVAMSGMCI